MSERASPASSTQRKALEAFLQNEESKQDPDDIFDLEEKLGEGSYGNVFKGSHKKSKAPVAVKIIAVQQGGWEELKKEIQILRDCRSDYIVQYYGSYMANTDDMWIVMEYCTAGSIADLMESTCRTLSEEQIQHITASVLLGLEYLHGKKLIHRDIKAGNILLTGAGQAKLADFGVSAQMNSTISKRQTVIGTPFWMAPEVIQEVKYDGKADIWSLGITMIEMAEGNPPLSDIHPMRAIFMIPANPSPTLSNKDEWHVLTNDFISQCLRKDLNQRPAPKILQGHPFVNQVVAQLKRSEGRSPVLEELVTLSLDAINRNRQSGTVSMKRGGATMVDDEEILMEDEENGLGAGVNSGTMIEYNSGTMVELNDTGTMVQTFASQEQSEARAKVKELKAELKDEERDFLTIKEAYEERVEELNGQIAALEKTL
eukprot:g7436.t1